MAFGVVGQFAWILCAVLNSTANFQLNYFVSPSRVAFSEFVTLSIIKLE